MSCTHHDFAGSHGPLKFRLEVLDVYAANVEDVREVVRREGSEGYEGRMYFKEVCADGEPLKGRARRRCCEILVASLLRGDDLSIAYTGGWDSGGSIWGPDGEDLCRYDDEAG